MTDEGVAGVGTAVRVVAAGRLAAADEQRVLDLVVAAARVDGGEPLAEDARLALHGGPAPGAPQVLHLLASAPGAGPGTAELVGYAQARTTAAPDGGAAVVTVEVLVHPGARRRGTGAALAQQLTRELEQQLAQHRGDTPPVAPLVHAWSHGDGPGAAALAARCGLRRGRELWRMERALGGPEDGTEDGTGGTADLPPLVLPEGVALGAFEPGRDEDAWLQLNARAFAGHPEQGAWGRAELDARTAEPWFDPAGLLLAVAADDPAVLLAAHWTKHDAAADPARGEVYVVGVDPAAQGRGLGRAVTLAGLHHLEARGVCVVELYVDGDNAAAQRTYTALGFVRAATDVVYEGRVQDPTAGPAGSDRP